MEMSFFECMRVNRAWWSAGPMISYECADVKGAAYCHKTSAASRPFPRTHSCHTTRGSQTRQTQCCRSPEWIRARPLGGCENRQRRASPSHPRGTSPHLDVGWHRTRPRDLAGCVWHCPLTLRVPNTNIIRAQWGVKNGRARTGILRPRRTSSIGISDTKRSDQRNIRALSPRTAVEAEKSSMDLSRSPIHVCFAPLQLDIHQSEAASSSASV